MLSILLRARLSALFHSLFSGNKKKRTIPMMLLFAFVFLYAGAAFLFLFGTVFALLLPPLIEADALPAFFALGGAAAFLLMLLGNVIFTKNQLYTANDNEFLLAMPIPPRTILLSRLITVLLTSFAFEAIVALPMLVVYLIFGDVRLSVLLSVLLVFLLLPFLAQSISALLAYLIARIAARIRRKNLLTTVFSLLFLGIYFFFVFGLDGFLEGLFEDVSPILHFVNGFWPLAALGSAMAGRLLPLLGLILLSLGITALTLVWLSHSFLRTALENRGAESIRYRARTERRKAPILALALRELRHLGASPGYIMNAGIGLLLLLIPPVFLLVDNSLIMMLAEELPMLAGIIPAIAGAIGAICLSTVMFSASSVSLEGRALWILRTCPVPTRDILLSKILFHMIPTAPFSLVAAILFAIGLRMTFAESIMLVLFLLAYTAASATFGLFANLLLPKMDWKNELVPIKQSGATFLAMLGSGVIAAVGSGMSVLLSLLLPAALSLFIGTLLFLGVTAALLAYILHGGVKQFEAL